MVMPSNGMILALAGDDELVKILCMKPSLLKSFVTDWVKSSWCGEAFNYAVWRKDGSDSKTQTI